MGIRVISFIIIMLLCGGCYLSSAYASDWTRGDTIREVSWEVLHVIDWGQTLEIARYPYRYSEYNPILGKHPSVGKVNLYMGAWVILHPVISYLLPKDYRKVWQYISIGVSAGCVGKNFSAGIGVRF